MNPSNFRPGECSKCGAKADLGMTCVGPRCRNCGCDNARPFGEVPGWGPLYIEPSEETRRLWGPLSPAEYAAGRNEWE